MLGNIFALCAGKKIFSKGIYRVIFVLGLLAVPLETPAKARTRDLHFLPYEYHPCS